MHKIPPISDDMEYIWLLIPAFNSAKHLNDLLQQTQKYIPLEKTIIVNDGSSDETEIIAKRNGANVITHPRNMGKGVALKSGFQAIIERGGKWIITLDGDLQHDPSYIPQFIESASNANYEMVIGYRKRKNSSMPMDRRFSNWATSSLLSMLTQQKIIDCQSGYRMIKVDMLSGEAFISDKYEFETELLLKLIYKGARIGWVEIPTNYNNENSSISRIQDTIRFLEIIAKHLTGRLYRNT